MHENPDLWEKLSAEFPRSSISWRAQNVKKDGTAALALAYIDARDVMDRLDSVVGPENWSDSYDVHENVTICTISIRVGDAWVGKSDGAGDTDVEAEKGRISDAFKRAAVRWGIGRYLYSIESPWVDCEAYESEYNGKKKWTWKRWKVDPWSKVRTSSRSDTIVPERVSGGVIETLQEVRDTPPSDSDHAVDKDFLVSTAGPKPRLSIDDSGPLYKRLQAQLREAAKVSLTALGEEWKANQPDIKRLPEKQEMELRDLKDSLKSVFLVNTP